MSWNFKIRILPSCAMHLVSWCVALLYFAVRRLAYFAVRRLAYPAVRRSKPVVFRSRASPYHSVKQKKDLQAVLFLSYKVALLIAIAYILSNFMMNWKMILDFIFYCCSVGDDFGGTLHDG